MQDKGKVIALLLCSDAIKNSTMVSFFNLRDMGAFHVLIVCHLSTLITNKFYMIFNPVNYD